MGPFSKLLLWSWALLAYVVFVRTVHQAFHDRWNDTQRKGVSKATSQSRKWRLFPGLPYLWAGPEILLRNYVRGNPLAIRTPENYYIHFSSEEHIRALIDASDEELSLHALSKDMFQPKYTMNGLKIHDKMDANGCLHTKVYRNVLRSNFPALHFPLSEKIAKVFGQQIHRGVDLGDGWTQIPSFSMAKQVIAAANSLTFFGPDLSAIPGFTEASLDYPEDLFRTAEVLRLTPSFIHPLLAPILMRNHRASKFMIKHLTPVVEDRLRLARNGGKNLDDVESQVTSPKDCIQFFVDASSRKDGWCAEKIVQVLLGTWFAGVHQPALTIVYALEDICNHPKYLDTLRQELSPFYSPHEGLNKTSSMMASLDNAPLLDAVLKESARLHPSDSISIRRKVLKPFTFADGTHILPGDVACVPSQAIMRDEQIYSDPTKFCPERHLMYSTDDGEVPTVRNITRFTDADMQYPLWGLGRHSCPGRYYASLLLKIFIAHLITHYDIKLQPQLNPRAFYFRSSIIPRPESSLLFRKRVLGQ